METKNHGTAYRVVVRGRFGERFASAFGVQTSESGEGTTTLTGSFRRPADVYRVLDRFRDLGIELVRLDAVD